MISDFFADKFDFDVIGVTSTPATASKKISLAKPDVVIWDSGFFYSEYQDVLSNIYQSFPQIVTLIFTSGDCDREFIGRIINSGNYDIVTREEPVSEFQKKMLNSLEKLTRCNRQTSRKEISREPYQVEKNEISQKLPRLFSSSRITGKKEIVAIGISTGGPNALNKMMPDISKDIPVPILIVQHMPPKFTKTLGESLNSKCQIRVREASDGDKLEPGLALIAPGGIHMGLQVAQNGTVTVRLIDGPPVNNCKPAVDVLFYDVAKIYGSSALGVIMTGMGSDGTRGLREMKKQGAHIIAQDEKSCVVFGMPRIPIEEGFADIVAPLENIAMEIMKIAGKRI
jgi:two-component system chemotaxis response regulator CheB